MRRLRTFVSTVPYVKEVRARLGLSQQEFADKIGVTRQCVADYESRSCPPGDVMLRIVGLADQHPQTETECTTQPI